MNGGGSQGLPLFLYKEVNMNNDYYDGITPDQRYKNELLNELRKLNANMEKLIERNAQAPETKAQPKPIGRESTNGRTNRMAKG